MAYWRHLQILALALLAAAAAAQEFPFKNGPLDPSLHSNKIFFNITDVSDIQGVWIGIKEISSAALPQLWSGTVPIDEMCDVINDGGLLYSRLDLSPLTQLILPPENEGELAKIIDMYVIDVPGTTYRAVEYEDGLMRMTDGSCLIQRPYFDWEVGKTMYLRNRRVFIWFDEQGQFQTSFNENYCVKGGFVVIKDDWNTCIDSVSGVGVGVAAVDHPFCSRERFLIDGQEKDGVILDTITNFECTAGPCLELPHSLPGFVKTQGWQPRD